MTTAPQMELVGMPPRRESIPIETSTELERVITQILWPLRTEERVNICLDLINFTGELCLVEEPLRLVDRNKRPMKYRPILVDRNNVIKAALRALQKTGAQV